MELKPSNIMDRFPGTKVLIVPFMELKQTKDEERNRNHLS